MMTSSQGGALSEFIIKQLDRGRHLKEEGGAGFAVSLANKSGRDTDL
jgi:hypothetical protein